METLQRNNVGFLGYGSGYFLEDGTEMDNVIDHNTGIAALSTIHNKYWNPAPVYSFVATDYSVMSAFWFKNNLNTMSRNLACNSPSPVLAVWYVPQKTQILRGPSAICIGNPDLDLPGIADPRKYAECYVPSNFTFRFVHATIQVNGGYEYGTYCNLYTSTADAPIALNAENVVYAM
eukprot:gene22945-27749_t